MEILGWYKLVNWHLAVPIPPNIVRLRLGTNSQKVSLCLDTYFAPPSLTTNHILFYFSPKQRRVFFPPHPHAMYMTSTTKSRSSSSTCPYFHISTNIKPRPWINNRSGLEFQPRWHHADIMHVKRRGGRSTPIGRLVRIGERPSPTTCLAPCHVSWCPSTTRDGCGRCRWRSTKPTKKYKGWKN